MDKLQNNEDFLNLDPSEKSKTVFDQPENIKITTQFIIKICDLRSEIILKNIWKGGKTKKKEVKKWAWPKLAIKKSLEAATQTGP